MINFLVYCPTNIFFVKFINVLHVVKNVSTLCNLFVDVIEWVEPNNFVHMVLVTNDVANYVVARKLIHEKHDNIFGLPMPPTA